MMQFLIGQQTSVLNKESSFSIECPNSKSHDLNWMSALEETLYFKTCVGSVCSATFHNTINSEYLFIGSYYNGWPVCVSLLSIILLTVNISLSAIIITVDSYNFRQLSPFFAHSGFLFSLHM